MTKLTLEQQELLFANDCKLINLRILKLINFSKFKGDYGNEKQTYINRTRRIICKGL